MLCKWALASCLSSKVACSARIRSQGTGDQLRGHRGWECHCSPAACVHRGWALLILPPLPPSLTQAGGALPWGRVRTHSASHSSHSIAFAVTERQGGGRSEGWWGHLTPPSPATALPVTARPACPPIEVLFSFEARLNQGFSHNNKNSWYESSTLTKSQPLFGGEIRARSHAGVCSSSLPAIATCSTWGSEECGELKLSGVWLRWRSEDSDPGLELQSPGFEPSCYAFLATKLLASKGSLLPPPARSHLSFWHILTIWVCVSFVEVTGG